MYLRAPAALTKIHSQYPQQAAHKPPKLSLQGTWHLLVSADTAMHVTYMHTHMHKSITSCILPQVFVLGYGSLDKNGAGVDVAFLEAVSHRGPGVRSKLLMLGLVRHSLHAACRTWCRTFSSISSTMSAWMLPCFPPWGWRTESLNWKQAQIKCFPSGEFPWARCLVTETKP